MAVNLQKHLSRTGAPSLHYHNRTMSRGEPLKTIGGVPCSSIGELITKSDIVFLSLSDDIALASTLDAMIRESGDELAGKTIVDTSTVHPSSSVKANTRLADKKARFVAAPVFGASPVAAEGKLLFILAGPTEAISAINPYLVGVMGRGVIRLGEDVKQSSLLKTAGNFMTAAFMEVVAEAHIFAEKTGLGSEAMEALIEQQYGPLPLSMSRRLTTGAYMPAMGEKPWSDLNLALKDVGHGIQCAEEMKMKLPVGDLVLGHLQEAKAYSDEQARSLDSSSMYGVLRRKAGLDFETQLVKDRDA